MNKTTVNKALTADEKPTPGYLYKEIAGAWAAAGDQVAVGSAGAARGTAPAHTPATPLTCQT